MKEYCMLSLMGQIIKDLVWKYEPVGLNQIIYGAEAESGIRDDKGLYWAIRELIVADHVAINQDLRLREGQDIRKEERYFTAPRSGFRNSRGHEMSVWAAMFVGKDQIEAGCYSLITEKYTAGPGRRHSTSKSFVTSVYSKLDEGQAGDGQSPEDELAIARHYIFNGETAFLGKMKVEVDALAAADEKSHIVIVSDSKKVFENIPEVRNPLTVYFFNLLPRTGLPQVDIFRRNI